MKQLKPINFLLLVIAGIINATGVVLFLVPAGLLDGAISGTSVFLANVTPIHISIFLIVLNVPLFFIGYRRIGWQFIIYSLTAIAVYSLMSYVYQNLLGWENGIIKYINNDLLIAAIFGGMISGIGSGMTIRYGGAIDGIEVMAVLYAKKLGITVGQFVMAYNVILYTVASVVTHNYLVGFYSVFSYVAGLKVIDFVVDGFDRGKSCTVITKKGEVLAKAISNEMGRGITVIKSKGFYSGENNTMLYCVVNRFEIIRLKSVINAIDPASFVAITDISEVMGNRIKLSIKSSRKKACDVDMATDLPKEALEAAETNGIDTEDAVIEEVLPDTPHEPAPIVTHIDVDNK
jgi:Uncharacterized conserved protein